MVFADPRERVFLRFTLPHAVPVIACVGVGLTLMVAALLKSADPRNTLAALDFVFGREASRPLLYALLLVEITLGAALIAALRPRLTLSLAAGLFLVFLGWIGYLKLINAPVTCGCGLESKHWLLGDGRGAAALRAGGLFAVSLVGWFLSRRCSPGRTQTEGAQK